MTAIECGSDLTGRIKECLSECRLTVTDSNVARLYPELCKNAFVIEAGEQSKSPDVLFSILKEMSHGFKRSDKIAALGGGVVGDITGLAAALYMRGVSWVSIPTTLLSMVDSGIGGKTAIDFMGIKNLVGAFHEPERTVISVNFTDTLERADRLSGCGEIIKTCLITSDGYSMLRSSADRLDGDAAELLPFVKKCVQTKSDVVKADFKESGLRKVLNIGHTVGHALEALDGAKLPHGEYVIKGMLTELTMLEELVDEAFYSDVINILLKYSSPPRSSASGVCELALSDKKNKKDGEITVMLPTAPGDVKEVVLSSGEFVRRYDRAVKCLRAK